MPYTLKPDLNESLSDAFRKIPQFTDELDLTELNLRSEDTGLLIDAFQKMPNAVTTLDFGGNCFWSLNGSMESLTPVFKAIPDSVTTLKLSNYGLQCFRKTGVSFDSSLISAVKAIPRNVTTLDLSGNDLNAYFNDQTLIQALQAIPSSVTTLDLSNNHLLRQINNTEKIKTFLQAIPSTVTKVTFSSNEPFFKMQLTGVREAQKAQQNLEQINQLLDNYLTRRQDIKDSSGKTKEYFYGSFFAWFQKSYTQKKEAVEALKSALRGNQTDLTKHLAVLENGTLGSSLEAFINSGKADSVVDKKVGTIAEFVNALQERNNRHGASIS